jgi:hypothetical protein
MLSELGTALMSYAITTGVLVEGRIRYLALTAPRHPQSLVAAPLAAL